MEINVSTSMGFTNQNLMKQSANELSQKSEIKNGQSIETVKALILSETVNTKYDLTNLSTIAHITLSKSMKETLKYLQAHAKDKRKRYVLGELWEQFSEYQDIDENYSSELLDFEIDYKLKNIFAA